MSALDTSLGLQRIDPLTEDHRDAYQEINHNAEQTTELILADRARLATLEGASATLEGSGVVAASGDRQLTVGAVRRALGVDANYAAFPGATILSDGRLFLVWREGTDHVTARDGVIKGSTSADNGLTWTPAAVVLELPGTDLRDPVVSTSGNRQRLHLAYFKASSANNAAGFFVRSSTDQGVTFGAEVRIDPHPYAAGCAPVVELANGNLLATWYGKASASDAQDSVFIAVSPDQGLTWGQSVKLVDGVAAATSMQEPYAAVSGDDVVIMYRHGNADRIGLIRSSNGGATWGVPGPVFAGSGRPSCLFTSSRSLLCVYRNYPGTSAQQHGVVRSSPDVGTSWTAPKLVERANPNYWTYSAPVEIVRGQVFCPSTVETSSSRSVLSARYITEGGGISPYGDVPDTGAALVLADPRSAAVVDNFDRANGPLGETVNGLAWVSQGGAVIDSGSLMDSVTDQAEGHLHYVNAGSPDVELEADVMWTGNTGICLVFRLQTPTNYLRAAIEDAGAAARLYKTVNGVTEQVGTTGAVSLPAGFWHRLRVTAVGSNIRFFVEDVLAVSAADATANTMPWVGLRTGANIPGTVHRARRFVARRRSGINN